MVNLPNYKLATNAAYETLQQYNGSFPQIEIQEIINMFEDIKVYKYSDIAKRLKMSPYEFIRVAAPSEYGYTVFDMEKRRWLLYYNETKHEESIRFTLAHELGHIILNHTNDNAFNNKEANCFARNILCPLPIRDRYNLKTPTEYCECFYISEPMATATINHYTNDAYYISKYNYMVINNKTSYKSIQL